MIKLSIPLIDIVLFHFSWQLSNQTGPMTLTLVTVPIEITYQTEQKLDLLAYINVSYSSVKIRRCLLYDIYFASILGKPSYLINLRI